VASVHLDLTADEIRELQELRTTRTRNLADRARRAAEADARASRAAPATPAAVPMPTRKPTTAPKKPPQTRKPQAPAAVPVQASGNVAAVVNFALAQVGRPYRLNTAGPGSFDCSGLTMRAYQQIGIRLPHQSEQQRRYGRSVSRAQLRAGDLIFYPGHVAIALDTKRMVHAANPRKGVLVASIYGTPVMYRRLVG